MLILAAIALALWAATLALPWQPWRCAERLEAERESHATLDGITVLVPARNEAQVIGDTLRALAIAAPDVPVIVIDDQSDDGTAILARSSGVRNLSIIHGTPPPAGWAGKLWALQQGLERAGTQRVLLLDADIRLAPGIASALEHRANAGYALVSLCAEPCWHGFAARWLLPVFVYFFKLLYPFALANRASSRVAAAAGGVVLIERQALIDAGGFGAWRDAIIDDCTLAARIKHAGYRCCIALTHGAQSLRRERLGDIMHMLARSAFVQLHESTWLLLTASALLVLAFWVPLLAIAFGGTATRILGGLAWLALAASYLPTLVYYQRNPLAAIALPFAATLFLAATWYSAGRAWAGTRSEWKGRRYRHEAQ